MGLLHATVVKQGWSRILLQLLPGFELATFDHKSGTLTNNLSQLHKVLHNKMMAFITDLHTPILSFKLSLSGSLILVSFL